MCLRPPFHQLSEPVPPLDLYPETASFLTSSPRRQPLHEVSAILMVFASPYFLAAVLRPEHLSKTESRSPALRPVPNQRFRRGGYTLSSPSRRQRSFHSQPTFDFARSPITAVHSLETLLLLLLPFLSCRRPDRRKYRTIPYILAEA